MQPVNIGLNNGLIPSGKKPLPEPMLTQIYIAILVSRGYNDLMCIEIHLMWKLHGILKLLCWNF